MLSSPVEGHMEVGGRLEMVGATRPHAGRTLHEVLCSLVPDSIGTAKPRAFSASDPYLG